MVVIDRNDDDQILACVRRHGKYQWVTMMINGICIVLNLSFDLYFVKNGRLSNFCSIVSSI